MPVSFIGFIYACYRLYEGELYDTRVINDEKGYTSINTSTGEMQYVLYKYHQLGEPVDFQSAYTSCRPPRIGGIYPDFYCKSQKLAGFYHGCW